MHLYQHNEWQMRLCSNTHSLQFVWENKIRITHYTVLLGTWRVLIDGYALEPHICVVEFVLVRLLVGPTENRVFSCCRVIQAHFVSV